MSSDTNIRDNFTIASVVKFACAKTDTHHIDSLQGCSEVIFQKKYSIYFFSSLILVLLYGVSALYVIVSAQWDQVVMPDDAFGAALGRRVLTARVIGIVTLLSGFAISLFYPKIFGRFLVLAVIWSWISFIDDTVVFQGGVLEATGMAGGYLVIFRPVYVLLGTYLLVEHWVRYGEKFE